MRVSGSDVARGRGRIHRGAISRSTWGLAILSPALTAPVAAATNVTSTVAQNRHITTQSIAQRKTLIVHQEIHKASVGLRHTRR